MKNKKAALLMTVGILFLATALSIVIYNNWDDQRAGKAAADVLTRIEKQIPKTSDVSGTIVGTSTDQRITMTQIDGRSYMGIISLPSQDITLPVLSSAANGQLRIAPCRYEGYAPDGRLIIAGHNYRRQFGRLGNLIVGDAVTFTDVKGNVYHYHVTGTEQISGTDVKRMESGDWDLSLYTCDMSGTQRITVRCALEK